MLLMLHSVFDFPEKEKYNRKLKKVQTLVQHFSNLDIYVPIQNISIDKSFINYEEENSEKKNCVVCIYKAETNVCMHSLYMVMI